jgi:PAS domain S-box-containing protein
MNKIIDRIIVFISESKNKRTFILLFVLFLLLNPLIFNTVVDYVRLDGVLSDNLYTERRNTAILVSVLFEEKLSGIIDLGVSLATRVQFRNLIERGEWGEAIKILEAVPDNFQFIDRIFLTDPEGTITADLPQLLGGVVGMNFAFRDWYRGVSREWQPYVSEIYRRTALPQYNLVAVAIPIKSDDGRVLGIMVLQIRLESLVAWAHLIEAGDDGFVYLVDQNGHIAGHPKVPLQGEIGNYREEPVIRELSGRQGGFGIFESPLDGENIFAAYQPIAKYGWGVVVAQPERSAFAFKRQIINSKLVLGVIFIIISTIFAFFIFRIISSLSLYHQKERRVFENMGDGSFVIDRGWKIIDINDAALKIIGWRREEVIGKPFRDVFKFIRAYDKKENIRFIEEAMLYKKTHFMEADTVLITKDGKELPVSDSAAPILDNNDEVVGAVIIFRDATREKESHQLKSDFAYASHQLRTPVTQTIWSIEAAKEATNRDDIGKYLDVASKSSQGTLKLVEQLVEVSTLDQGQAKSALQDIKFSDFLEKLLNDVREAAKEKRVGVEIGYTAKNLVIKSDPKLLHKAISEVLDNAVICSPDGGKIAVKVIEKPDNLVLEISDRGPGISSDEQPLIFTRFFRGSNFKSINVSGAGLGLYLAKKYLELLGGKIWFESEEGEGTTFFISLPK